MKTKYDILIIGTGIAGLTAAIKLAENTSLEIGLITRGEKPEESNTYWAQGGIIYVGSEDKKISDDIQLASKNTSYDEAIKVLLKDSSRILNEVLIEKAKTEFNKNEDGSLAMTQEAAHSIPRILYNADATGKAIEISLLNYINEIKNISILTKMTAIDLITPAHHGVSIHQRYEKDRIVGAYVFDQEQNKVHKFLAKKTILATGGANALYLHHTNGLGARGDGHAMVRRAGGALTNMEFIQFHPTTFFGPVAQKRFLLTEALRGEGAKLLNPKGERFMKRYHKDLELAPRDIVSDAIMTEMIENKWDSVFLDITHESREHLETRFPTIFNHLLNHKLDMSKDLIPVVPAAHYTCGGVKTDLDGQTSLKDLYAVGEVACTGLHGVNRLASTSLLEGLTFGHKAAEKILTEISDNNFYEGEKIKDWTLSKEHFDMSLINQDKMVIKHTMWNYVGIKKSRNRLLRAKAMVSELNTQIQKFYKDAVLHDDLIGLRNSVEVCYIIIASSLRGHQSIKESKEK